MTYLTRIRAGFAALALVPLAAPAQWLDYAQADASRNASTLVLVSAVGSGDASNPAPIASATYANWSTGDAASVGLVYRWAVPLATRHWVLGAGIGVNASRNRAPGEEQRDAALAARLQSEWYGPAPGGSYYALAQLSSYRQTWLATAQYTPSAVRVAPEWTSYRERGYRSTSVGVRVATGAPRWFVRIGVTRGNGESAPYVGVVYNGF